MRPWWMALTAQTQQVIVAHLNRPVNAGGPGIYRGHRPCATRGDYPSFEPSTFVEAVAVVPADQPTALENAAARLIRFGG
jgi:hypothetical protein